MSAKQKEPQSGTAKPADQVYNTKTPQEPKKGGQITMGNTERELKIIELAGVLKSVSYGLGAYALKTKNILEKAFPDPKTLKPKDPVSTVEEYGLLSLQSDLEAAIKKVESIANTLDNINTTFEKS